MLLALAALWLVGSAALRDPRAWGDGGEYLLMTQALLRHGTPDVRPADVAALAAANARHPAGIDLATTDSGFYAARNGRRYGYHFWAYSLATLPLTGVLRLAGLNELRAAPLTNALLFLLALRAVLATAALTPPARLLAGALWLLSPPVWFVMWPHPETATAALVLIALVRTAEGRHAPATLCAALGATQNAPLALLTAALLVRGCVTTWREPAARASRLARLALAGSPAAVPPLFYQALFGTPSLIAQGHADPQLLSLRRALELLLDLNIGLLPYAPVAVTTFVLGVLAALFRPRAAGWPALARATVFLALALACSVGRNWNHGTAGPSRYAVWLWPLVLLGAVAALAPGLQAAGARRWLALAGALLAVASQAAVVLGRGGLLQGEDYLRHSSAARFVLERWPWLYSPSPAIFRQRTLGAADDAERLALPAVYRAHGRCFKAWARAKDERLLRELCRTLPPGYEEVFARQVRRKDWMYFDFVR